MSSVLVVDDVTSVREPIAAGLRTAGYRVETASSGPEALRIIFATPPDVLVLDLSMPGMSGTSVLRAMRVPGSPSEHTPVVLLTASTDREVILNVAQLGVREYMLKSKFAMPDLLDRVKRCIASTSVVPLAKPAASMPTHSAAPVKTRPPVEHLTESQTLDRIAAADIKSLPAAVEELLALTDSSSASREEIASCLNRDAPLAASVIRLANSAAFAGTRTPILSIEDAVRHVGIGQVHRLASCAAVMSLFNGEQESLRFLRNWQQSIAVATLMERLAPAGNPQAVALAHLVGLCHQLPDIMLFQHFPKEVAYTNVLSAATGRTRDACYAEVFGVHYPVMAARLLARTGLPQAIIAPLTAFFYSSARTKTAAQHSDLCVMLMIAVDFANGLLLGPTTCDPIGRLLPEGSDERYGDVSIKTLGGVETFRANCVARANLALGSDPQQTARVAESLVPRRPLRVCYVCDSTISPLDSLEAALALVTQSTTRCEAAEVIDRFPSSCDLILVASQSLLILQKLRAAAALQNIPVRALRRNDHDAVNDAVTESGTLSMPTTAHSIDQLLLGLEQNKPSAVDSLMAPRCVA